MEGLKVDGRMKVKTLKENFKKMGVEDMVTMKIGHAEEVLAEMDDEFDFIFMDAAKAQYIHYLPQVLRILKPGGVLMFSTCTVSLAENQGNMQFLTDECGLEPVDFYDALPADLTDETARGGYIQLYGRDGLTDGFFIGKLVKRK